MYTAARSPSPSMSDVRKNEAAKRFEQLWGDDSHAWSHDQRMLAEGVHVLLQKTTTITESNLRSRIDTLINQNPEACAAERTSGSSRVVKLPLNHRLPAEPAVPSEYTGKVTSDCMKQRVIRLRDRIVINIHNFAQGLQASDTYKVKPENLGLEQEFGSLYDCLAQIHDCQQLLYTELEEQEDENLTNQFRREAKQWKLGTWSEKQGQLLSEIQHALERLRSDLSVTDSARKSYKNPANAIRNLRVNIGHNNSKIFKGIKLHKYRGAVVSIGDRTKEFENLLKSEARQFEVTQMLAELESQDVKNAYQAFVQDFANRWTQSKWLVKDCNEYERGLIEQERLVSEALERERQHKTTDQPSRSHERPQTTKKPPRSSLPPLSVEDQSMEHEVQTRRRRTESANLLRRPPTYTEDVEKQSEGSLEAGIPDNDMGRAAHERLHDLAVSPRSFLESHSHTDESPKLIVRLDPARTRGKAMSRRLRWSPTDTRTTFLDRVAELFPGKAIQQVNARLPGKQVTIQATGPEEEWDIVREEWLGQLQQPSKKESSAAVYLVEATE